MTATLVYSNATMEQVFNTLNNRNLRKYKTPQVMEFTDMEKLLKKLIHVQYLLYPPDYMLVEFNGMIYNASDPELIQIIEDWIDIHYMKESIL